MASPTATFVPPKRRSIHDEFPGFRIAMTAQADRIYRVECRTCYRDGSANWSRPHAKVTGGRGIRQWISEHEHQLSPSQAVAEWIALAPRNGMARQKLRAHRKNEADG